MTPYLQFFCWGNYHIHNKEYIDNYLNTARPKLIEYISQEEWAFSGHVAEALLEYADKHDVELKVLLNSYNMWDEKTLRPRLKNLIYEDCPTFIMEFVLSSFTNQNTDRYNQSTGNPWIYDFTPRSEFNFKLISMTHKVHWWRSKMIDHFEEYGIINPNNCVIWHNAFDHNAYDYKFFKPRVIERDKFKDESGGFNSFLLPSDFSKTWFSAVYETDIDIIAMSEKTFAPLLYMKPFIVLGSKGYHQFLKSLGFQLFEEFIDYSFDSETDTSLRIEKYCREVSKINDMNFKQIKYYNELIKEKLIHNKKQVFKVFFDKALQPKTVTHWQNIIPSGKEILDVDLYVQENFYRAAAKRGWYTKVMLPF